MRIFKKFRLLPVFLFLPFVSSGQHTPFNPISYRVLNPLIFNPAITGSKDYSSINLIAGLEGASKSQIISADTRIAKKATPYFATPEVKGFSNFGLGGAIFNDLNGLSRNLGLSTSCSYHIPLNKENLSFLSIGVAVKGVFNTMKPDPVADSLLILENKNTFFPNIDAGSYYYGTNLYAGFSLTNLLGNPGTDDSLDIYPMPVSTQYFFFAGYKILIYRALNIVMEPSFLITTDKPAVDEIKNNIEPIIKIYLQDFCLGTYFNDKDRTSFFFQYRFPMINIGAFFELPKKTPYYKKEVIVEFNVGINFNRNQNRITQHSRW